MPGRMTDQIKISEKHSLKPYNTFGLDARARFFTEVCSEAQIQELAASSEFRDQKHLILGGGSNILFAQDFASTSQYQLIILLIPAGAWHF